MPNVLILMSDEHNATVSSVYGHPRVDTPNMERLAAEGVTYDAAYCPSPLCAPCRSSFLSGLPVHQAQVYNNCNIVEFDYPSYGGVLRDQGVYTAQAGKADVYCQAGALGFSELMRPGNRKQPGDINFCREPLTIREDGATRATQYGPKDGAFANDLAIVDDSVAWLTDRAPRLDQPWTLTVNIVAPHFPHYVTDELWEKYRDDGDLPAYGNDAASANHPYAQDLRRHFQTDAMPEEHIRGLRRGYLGRVDFVDRQLGRLLDALEASGARNDTVVIYTSDHGEMLGKFGMWWKSAMYDDAVRVPLIAAGPGFASGIRASTAVGLLDVQASLFAATGTERPAAWWGEPLQGIAINDPNRVAFAEYHGHGTRSGTFMVRKGDWKLLYHAAAPDQLFNLRDDPQELDNRFDREPLVAADMERELRNLVQPEVEAQRAHAFERRQQELIAMVAD